MQLAWIELDVPQCGYCQSGMIMSVVAMLKRHPKPTDADIDAEITNACRCSTYHRIRQAIHLAAAKMSAAGGICDEQQRSVKPGLSRRDFLVHGRCRNRRARGRLLGAAARRGRKS